MDRNLSHPTDQRNLPYLSLTRPIHHVLLKLIDVPGYIGNSAYRRLRRRFFDQARLDFHYAVTKLTPDDVVIDLGANVGKVTSELAESGAQVYAFEPDPTTFRLLEKNTRNFANVTRFKAAAGTFAGQVDFLSDQNTGGNREGSAVINAHNKSEMENAVAVEQVDFLSFLDDIDKPVAIIKMDIEGSEWDILDKLLQPKYMNKFNYLFVETHERFDAMRYPHVKKLARLSFENNQSYINFFWP